MDSGSQQHHPARFIVSIIAVSLAITALIVLWPFGASGNAHPAVATYSHGLLQLAIPYHADHAGPGSLTMEVLDPEDHVLLRENLPGDAEDTPYHHCLAGEMELALARSMDELPEKERNVLALYYFEELTMKEVGDALGVGESRVSQLHSMALVHLRGRLASRGNPRLGARLTGSL